jgi:hypothetical protein
LLLGARQAFEGGELAGRSLKAAGSVVGQAQELTGRRRSQRQMLGLLPQPGCFLEVVRGKGAGGLGEGLDEDLGLARPSRRFEFGDDIGGEVNGLVLGRMRPWLASSL